MIKIPDTQVSCLRHIKPSVCEATTIHTLAKFQMSCRFTPTAYPESSFFSIGFGTDARAAKLAPCKWPLSRCYAPLLKGGHLVLLLSLMCISHRGQHEMTLALYIYTMCTVTNVILGHNGSYLQDADTLQFY